VYILSDTTAGYAASSELARRAYFDLGRCRIGLELALLCVALSCRVVGGNAPEGPRANYAVELNTGQPGMFSFVFQHCAGTHFK
jgi:hypothetical protein